MNEQSKLKKTKVLNKEKGSSINTQNIIKLDDKHVKAGCAKGLTSEMNSNQLIAAMTTRSVNTAFTVKKFANVEDSVEVSDYILELQKAGNEVVDGNLGRLERMLTGQAIALDAIFNKLAIRAANSEYMKNYEGFMRLAFKAQAQSRSTVEALAMLKYPQPYISQTNIGHVGHNQVNNAYALTSSNTDTPIPTVAENLNIAPNKLLDKVTV
jgi:hypothetical protein